MKPILSALAVALLSGTLAAETVKVAAGESIQDAIDGAAAGDTIVVASGTFTENVVIDGHTDLVLRGKGKTTVDAGGAGVAITVSNSSGITLRKLGATGGGGVDGFGFRVIGSSDVTITRCRTDANADDGVRIQSSTAIVVRKSDLEGDGDSSISVLESTDVLLAKNKIKDSVAAGVHVQMHSAESMGVTIRKNRISRSGQDGVLVEGTGAKIAKNKIRDTEGAGVRVADPVGFTASDVTVVKNRIDRPDADGIRLGGTGNTARKNIVKQSAFDALRAEGGGAHTVTKNVFVKPTGRGVYVETGSDGSTFRRNHVVKPGDDGFDVMSGSSVLKANKVTQSGDCGFRVEGPGNSFTLNKAYQSETFDLQDLSDGTNDYTGGNAFGTVDPGGNQP